MRPIHLLPVLLLIPLAACGGGDAAGESASVRDSAGIQIVENRGGRWGGGGWRLGGKPSLQIGVAEGDRAFQLDRVRGALRLGDGRIVVANAGTQDIRYFSPEGRHLATVGRSGEGPGEFKGVSALRRLPGDSVLVYDLPGMRLSWMDPSGLFIRSVPLPQPGGMPTRFVDRFSDGTLLLSTSMRRFLTGAPPAGTSRDTLLWLRSTPEGVLDSLPVTPGGESAITLVTEGGQVRSMSVLTLPFMRGVQTAAAGDRYWQGATETYEIVLRRADGTPERIVRRAVEPQPVRGAYLDSLRRVQLPQGGPEAAKAMESVAIPERLPAFERLLVDDGGNLWVQRHAWPGTGVQAEWDVFDPEGMMLGTLRMPGGFRATHVGDDFVLGVWTDEDEVEYVRMYDLKK